MFSVIIIINYSLILYIIKINVMLFSELPPTISIKYDHILYINSDKLNSDNEFTKLNDI